MKKGFNTTDSVVSRMLSQEEPKPEKKYGRPQNDSLVRGGSQDGLPEDTTRATFILKISSVEALNNYAYTERITLKEAINSIIEEYIDNYKKDHTLLEDPKNEKARQAREKRKEADN